MAYEESEAKRLVIEAAKKLSEKGLIVRTWGNISARISDTEFVITPSGMDYRNMTPDDIVKVDLDGAHEGNTAPSSEYKVHAAGYRKRPQADFIIHTHQTNASAISILGKDFKYISGYVEGGEEILGTTVPCARYGRNGSQKLAGNVAEALMREPDAKAVLMKNHGALCLGRDVGDAFSIAEVLEQTADFRYREMVKEANLMRETDPKTDWNIFEAASDMNAEKRQALYGIKNVNCIIYCESPYIKLLSEINQDTHPYIDDQAQIAGALLPCLPADSHYPEIAAALKGKNAVLVEGVGAVCTGIDREEAEAVCLVLEKGAKAAVLGLQKKVAAISGADCRWDRKNYVRKYSALKNL